MTSSACFLKPAVAALTYLIIVIGNAVMANEASPSTNIIRNSTGGYSQRSVEVPAGSRVLYISGQTATDESGHTPADVNIQADIFYETF